MLSVQSYALPTQKKRRISGHSYLPTVSPIDDDGNGHDNPFRSKRKRKCTKLNQLDYKIMSLSNNQYICHIKKPICVRRVEDMIREEYIRLQDSLYTPTYHVEYDAMNGDQIYVEDTDANDIREKVWQNLNFHRLYSELARREYQDGQIAPRDNVLTINNQYDIPFQGLIKDYSVVQYSLEGGPAADTTHAVVEIHIETDEQSSSANTTTVNTTTHRPVLEEVPDAMFSCCS